MQSKSHPKIPLPLLLLTLLLLLIPTTLTYSCPTPTSTIQLGQSTVVCMHVVYVNSVTGTNVTQTYAFKVTVDKFSAVKVGNLKTPLMAHTAGPVYVVLQAQNSQPVLSMLLSSPTLQSGIYRSLFSTVINIQKGTVTNITDDNADCGNCDTTNSQICTAGTEYKCYTKGAKYAATTDPRIFVSWIGTDVAGNHMLSHTKRLSRFSQYSIGSIYSKAISAFTS